MNKAFLFMPAWALAVSLSFASENPVASLPAQDAEPMINIDSKQLNLSFGDDSYEISLSKVADKDYKILGLIQPTDQIAYSLFMYCALRKIAVERGFEYWLLLPSRLPDTGYVGYLRTQADAKYFAEKSIKRVKIHSVHEPSMFVNTCRQGAQSR